MIFYGWRTFASKKGTFRRICHCNNCNADTKWELRVLWTWFTLFFIPIFPIYVERALVCPICEYGIKVTKKNRDEIMADVDPETLE